MRNKNIELTILKALGIIAVVSGHIGINLFNIIGIPLSLTTRLFPEYSYHIPLFIFASGYFYKRIYESSMFELCIKRFNNLIKYTKSNLFYCILSFALIKFGFLVRNIDFSFKSLLIEPFLGGFQFYFNGPGWFVPFLFLLQLIYIGTRKILKLKFFSLRTEFVFLIFLVGIGIISTVLSTIYPVRNDNVHIFQSMLRILFGLQFYQMGFFYKEFLETRIKFSYKSFLWVLICKIIVTVIFGHCTFSLRVLQFNNYIILPLVVSILGILYCMHLSIFIVYLSDIVSSKILGVICVVGDNTWSIMMHHLLIKWCLGKIYNLEFIPNNISIIGSYLVTPILCVLLPILFAYFYNFLSISIKKQS